MKIDERTRARASQPLELEGHGPPVSRRDFLSRGLISGLGLLAAPSLLGMVPRSAWGQAAECGVNGTGAGKIPFLVFDLAGGVNVAASNVLVGGPGGQLDFLSEDGYRMLGLPADMTPDKPGQINTDLGLAFHSDSPFLSGIFSKTSAATRSRTNGSVICARSENDTGNNPHNPMYGIHRAGADGGLLALIGTRTTESGGRSGAPMSMVLPAARPTKIDRPSDARGLIDTGRLAQVLGTDDAAAVMQAVKRISDRKLERVSEDAVLRELVSCGYLETADLVQNFGDPSVLDPTADPQAVGAGGVFTQAELGESRFRKTASVMKLVVDGFAGAGTVEMGGYDYHDSTRATGEIRDFLAGQCMGAALEFAARRGKPLMLYVLSDGSVFSDGTVDGTPEGRGKLIWKGDRSSTAAVFFLVYSPSARPALTRPDAHQLGHFRPNGAVETEANRIAANVALLAEAIVLNYLALHGEQGRMSEVLPGHSLGNAADLDALTAFQPIV